MATDLNNQELSQLLIAVALKRDKSAFTRLFHFFAPKIKRIASRRLSNPEHVNEVIQDTMTTIWRKAELFDPDKGAALSWVFMVMRNVVFDALRKMQSNLEDHLSEDLWPLQEETQSSDPALDDHLATSVILAGLDALPESQRQVVQGVYFQELSQQELAEQLNVPVGTIKSRLRLALAKLKQQLGEGHD